MGINHPVSPLYEFVGIYNPQKMKVEHLKDKFKKWRCVTGIFKKNFMAWMKL